MQSQATLNTQDWFFEKLSVVQEIFSENNWEKWYLWKIVDMWDSIPEKEKAGKSVIVCDLPL